MNIESLREALIFVVLLLVQVLVFNHVHLFNCATPLLYIYVALLFPRNTPRWVAVISCFVMGFLVDIFSNTPGVSMASLTFLGLIQPLVLKLFLQHDSADDMKPSMRTLGIGRFVYYTLVLVVVECLLFCTLETFNFVNWIQWLESIVGSSIITIILILTLANFRSR